MRKERDVELRRLSLNDFYPYLCVILKYIRMSLKNPHGLIFFFVHSCFLQLVIDCRFFYCNCQACASKVNVPFTPFPMATLAVLSVFFVFTMSE